MNYTKSSETSTISTPTVLTQLSKYEIENINKKILVKVKMDLKNKYYNWINEKRYHLATFDPVIKKEIIRFSFYNYPLYGQLFKIIERKFLQEISGYIESDKRGLITPEEIQTMLGTSVPFHSIKWNPVGKVTLRNMIKTQNNFTVVDKYTHYERKEKPKSKTEVMLKYSQSIK